jgi:hypothetical protein
MNERRYKGVAAQEIASVQKKCRREKVHKKDANPTQWIMNASYSEHIGKIPMKSHTTQKGVMEVKRKIVLKEVNKGVWGMPRLSEAKKDVISCEKLRGSANSY